MPVLLESFFAAAVVFKGMETNHLMINFRKPFQTLVALILSTFALTVLAPYANASGICVSASSNVYGGGTLATDPNPAIFGCNYGFSNTTGGFGGIVTTSPNVLPSPLSQLTSATLNFSDPTGTSDM